MNRVFRPAPMALAAAAALMLAACGGGGGGSAAPAPAPAPATVVSTAGTLQVTVPAPTYAASSVMGGMFTKMNDLRARAGAGVMAQSAMLDTAAQAHADYMHVNGTSDRLEVAGQPGFYADTPPNRMAKAGYVSSARTETIGGTGASFLGKDCALGLMATLYRAAALLGPYQDVGYGSALDGQGTPTCVTELGDPSTATYPQVPASGALIAYPYGGQTDAVETFNVSSEVPSPPASVLPNATAGTPVLVSIRNADFVNFEADGSLAATVSKFEIRDASSNVLPSVLFAGKNVAGAGVTLNTDTKLGEGFVVLVPLAPLLKNSSYSVSFSATLKTGAAALTKSWSFTTNP